MDKSSLVLASGSPRRKELLTQLGYEFSVLVTDIEEQQQPDGRCASVCSKTVA